MPSGPDPARPAAAGARTAVCICVDDFGLHPAVNDAVFALARRGRISATSAMVGGAGWTDGAARLRAGELPALEVGLHLDLTEPLIRSGDLRMPLRRLIGASYARRLDAGRLRAEVERQLDAFESDLGRPPAYVDGHQHVHQLPQVRDALLSVLSARYPGGGRRPWLRATRPRAALAHPKAAVIAALGARAPRASRRTRPCWASTTSPAMRRATAGCSPAGWRRRVPATC